MSFSSEQKEQIISGVYKSRCCRRALLYGILFAKGYKSGEHLTLSLDKEETADFTARLIREFFSTDADRLKDKSGGRRIVIGFKSDSAEKYISNIKNIEDILVEKCPNCKPSFLKGAEGSAETPP